MVLELAKRKNTRLQGYDYSSNGAYFVTICTKDRSNIFCSDIVGVRIARSNMTMNLSDIGKVVDTAINKIPNCYVDVTVDKYIIMPNHIHLILLILGDNGRAMRAPTIPNIINQMKGYVTKQIGISIWQKLFYDRIIRNELEYQKIWEYIDTNPIKWEEDEYYK